MCSISERQAEALGQRARICGLPTDGGSRDEGCRSTIVRMTALAEADPSADVLQTTGRSGILALEVKLGWSIQVEGESASRIEQPNTLGSNPTTFDVYEAAPHGTPE